MRSFVLLAAVLAAGSLAGNGCGGGGQLSGSGGAGMAMTGRAGGQAMSGTAGSGAAGAGVTGAGGGGVNSCYTPYPAPIVPPDILIVLDTSTSMNDGFAGPCAGGCGAQSKWTAAVASIESAVSATPLTASWGLKLLNDAADACAAGGIAVPVLSWSATLVDDALARRSNASGLASPGNTPTRAAIDVASANLLGRPPGPKPIIVLVTDGAPDCGPGASDPSAGDGGGATAAIANAAVAGIGTCVLGLGTSGGPAEATLTQMAAAGANGCPVSPAYLSIASGADLFAALGTIAAQGGDCRFAIPPAPTTDGTTSRTDIAVVVAGTEIPEDPNDGWTYTDVSYTSLQLHGAACAASRQQTVSVVFRCSLI
jgi:hypothetical protein